ncbi:MAG: hypothetical protein A2268_13235 [Candidatus Raymondbacteria bacterium RifOxyA12_full_50_37]|uniref:Uncharacterized protein n=1 Tax=Candidatus Raymondbacteria bacterium RIFOXYD12_FULL_49_13 TaxID=1817890 RepID=A0A1F7EZW8_UNCRA|nr:MAG: hypothetical protein A2268_13235 [Candidatus Raymondbacteria bacterium RifOxyA12_full_50_37]OGJ93025.1 MAG: hypothetical protein A2248_18370 [Candidatus Raymondbacteria bacterium RIFOXYA2_FULL_49_16]OGJ94858.1 MAG: hypothetical protein A2350_15425 [Candidatus Raymondbacteria bacterium RifOxyB12_full_50_8]OGJ99938.1 MAG: hypothetical protein A2519_00350 [Candidatus Raymondbacteria bacterium RIFOXYD12_FULL_49_13]OGK04129.1 MAG: hypothetical protein A2487_14030 [Candidatus Raymondbacteria 
MAWIIRVILTVSSVSLIDLLLLPAEIGIALFLISYGYTIFIILIGYMSLGMRRPHGLNNGSEKTLLSQEMDGNRILFHFDLITGLCIFRIRRDPPLMKF